MWFMDITATYDEGTQQAVISRVTAVRADGGSEFEIDGGDVLRRVFEAFNNRGANVVWVWDMGYFGMWCDYYALKTGMKLYKDAEKGGLKKTTPMERCYNVMYAGGAGCIDFKITLERTAYTHEYGKKSKSNLHSVEYRGMSEFFRDEPLEDVMAGFGITETGARGGVKLLNAFLDKLSELAGEDVRTREYLQSVYTIGGAAKRKYLKIRYPNGSLRTYQKEHPQDEEGEDYLRMRHLQLGGMCFFPLEKRARLYKGTIRKYDVNGLYSATANGCGELTFPRPSTWDDFVKDRREDRVYIVVLKGLIAYKKAGMPPVFSDPIGTGDGNIIEFDGEIALFRELYDALKAFYDLEEFEVVRVLVCDKKLDNAMMEYNDHFQTIKAKAARDGDALGRGLAKLFLNNLIGKFTQRTKYREVVPFYNPETDMVEFRQGELVDKWERRHFDYVRGAYIYVMARVKVMLDIARLSRVVGVDVAAHHYYTDTDSIVTDIELEPEMVDPYRLGAYKLEDTFSAFGVIGKKAYYGRTVDGKDKLIAAGIRRGLVIGEIHAACGDDIDAELVWQILNSEAQYTMQCVMRVHGGGALLGMPVRVHELDIEDY